jgi:hypothetical protein
MEHEQPSEAELREIEHDPSGAGARALRLLAAEVRRLRARERSWREALARALERGEIEDLHLAARAIVAGEEEGPARATQPIPEHD